MGSKTKHNTKSFANTTVESTNITNNAVTTNKIGADAVTSGKINNGTVTADDLASSLDLSSKTLTLPNSSFNSQFYNIGLLGFKMAVNESLTVFNLVDGVVDEFNDESGTDEAEGVNDGGYCATSDFYQNNQGPLPISAGFAVSSITEPDTSSTTTNPAYGTITSGTFTVPDDLTSVNAYVFGAGGGSGSQPSPSPGNLQDMGSGGGGFTTGTLAVTSGQVLNVMVGEGGGKGQLGEPTSDGEAGGNGGISGCATPSGSRGGGGGGLVAVTNSKVECAASFPQFPAPGVYFVAGSGGGNVAMTPGGQPGSGGGGGGGGLTGQSGGGLVAQTGNEGYDGVTSGGGGDQEQGGQAGCGAQNGNFFAGGNGMSNGPNPDVAGPGGGGAGYYGGGGGGRCSPSSIRTGGGGGGSSYYGHPQVTCGSTEAAGDGSPFPGNKTGNTNSESGGVGSPFYVDGTSEGLFSTCGSNLQPAALDGEDGYVLLTGTRTAGGVSSTTIVSSAFTSTSVPTTSRIVVFEENVDTPTLNTDIIASVSRDGTNFTNATLSDSGYVTGSSGQRILTGQVDISGQPSGQSMRWKLQLANNQVKIHGVSLSWA